MSSVDQALDTRRMPGSLAGSSNDFADTGTQRNKTNRMILGIIVLIIVDLIWVTSSELTEKWNAKCPVKLVHVKMYTFHHEKFDKPFFSTYLKTSMFLIFLVGFVFWKPWHEQCRREHSTSHLYVPIRTEMDATDSEPEPDSLGTIDDNANDSALSPPSFIPVKYEPNSGNDSDSEPVHSRSVRFNKLAEVRHLSESEAAEALFSRLSYQASVNAEQLAFRLANRLSPRETAQLAVTFCFLWFLANYTYQLALSHTQPGIVNVLSSASSFFTLLLANIFPAIEADRFTVSKFIAVLISFSGVIVVSLSDLRIEGGTVPLGAIYALLSAMLYSAYLVFLRKKADHEDKLDIPMFFGFVGLFNLILLWPLFFVFHFTGFEVFEWPNKRDWLILIVNGIIGTVFSEVLWLWGCFLTSSLIATLAVSLMIPLTMVADVVIKRVSYSYLFYIGTAPMLFSFVAVTLLSHYENWDPIMSLVKRMVKKFRVENRYQRVLVSEGDQNESLIGINHDCEDGDITDEDEDEDVITRTEADRSNIIN